MLKVFEAYGDEVSSKDGGFVFQAILSHLVKWEIVNGETRIDPKRINSVLHQIDVFPDIKLNEGSALLTYIVLSEINLLRRKFELASEAIKKRLKPEYGAEIRQSSKIGITSQLKNKLNEKYFKGTYYEVNLTTDHLVLREVSTSGIDSGSPKISLKVSTSMVDTLDGRPIQTWEKFKVQIDGSQSLTLPSTEERISNIKEYDEVEKNEDQVFQTILPSLVLEFKGDRVSIDTYSNRSSLIAVGSEVNYDSLFNLEDETKKQVQTQTTTNK